MCLLIAALPLQSDAAAGRLCCAAMADGAMPAADTDTHDGHNGHCHHAQMQAPHCAAAQVNHDHQGRGHAHSCASCAVCAACGAAAFAVSAVPMPQPVPPYFSHVSPAPVPLLAGPVPTGLERPPRSTIS